MSKRNRARAKGFASGFEMDVVEHLRHQLILRGSTHASSIPLDVELYKIKIPYIAKKHYIPDVVLPNGIIVELKGGIFPPDERRKMQAVIKSNPGLDIRFVFGEPDRRQMKGRLIAPAKWSEKHGYKWAAKWIPVDWLLEDCPDAHA